MTGYFAGHIEHRKTHPTDDLISTLMNARGTRTASRWTISMCWARCGCC